MKPFHSSRLLTLTFLLGLLSACATTPPAESEEDEQPELIAMLPKQLEGYSYGGFHIYPEAAYGYAVRYLHSAHHHADIYVYPVPDSIKHLSHKDIVLGMTYHTKQEIELAQEQGLYLNYQVIQERAYDNNGTITTKIEGEYLKNNLAAYTLVYLTESSGKLVKARITMPDNEANRDNPQWDNFISQLFSFVLKHIDKA